MIVALIEKNAMYKLKLPKNPVGNYWITGENNKKLVNIEGKGNRWQVTTTSSVKILKGSAVKSIKVSNTAKNRENLIDKIELKEYGINFIYLKDVSNNVFVLYCYPSNENTLINLNIKTTKEITIGQDKINDIVYMHPLVEKRHARIYYSNGKLMIENFNTSFGTFINGEPVTKKVRLLFNGDVIFIMGLKIIIIGKEMYINNPYGKVRCSSKTFEINNDKVEVNFDEEEDEKDNDVELYSEKEYFARAPKITNLIEHEKIVIDPPPENQNKGGMPLIYVIGQSLSMGLISVISMVSTLDSLASGEAKLKDTVFSLLMSGAMLLTMLLIPILNSKYDKKVKKKQELTRQTRYKEYINSKIDQIDQIMEKQRKILFENYISAEECAKIILHRSPRLWERKIEGDDFLTIRVGIGDLPLDAEIEYPKQEFSMEDDNLVEILNTIAKKSKILKNVPITYSLAEKNISALIVKDERIKEKYIQNVIMQLIALHSYSDLKLVFFLKEDEQKRWEHLKTIPHIWDNAKQIRFWAENYNEMKEVSAYLENEFANRINQQQEADYKLFEPYYLIITNDYKKIENMKIINDILESKRNVGFSIFCITDNLVHLPNECEVFINLENEDGIMFENEISSTNQKRFKFDSSYTFFFERMGKQLSNIPIKFKQNAKMSLPSSYTFLEMYDAGKIEQLNILERWKNNDSTVSLQAPIGIDGAGMPIILDIHERFHGPHGLIAGSTGSGKSEFIITYILSLAVNYHPDDVTMILIDYKGGGLAGAFQKREIKLPHLVGTITNIDKVGLQRSLASIQSELRRRQVLFNEARNKTDEGTIDIYKYQKLYHQGIVTEPIPHLLIICDEFAELKQQQEEFMDELISVARIGRSLGVHLILATQKPAGIVNEQIRSNSKFAICLKVQDREDSVDVIKRPDAAFLKKAGQFYMQVGNNEYFTLGQAAWAGAPYIPSDVIKKSVDNSIKFVSNIGMIIKEADDTKKQSVQANGEQLTNIVTYLYELAKRERIEAKPLWMENIPANIYINQIREKYNIKIEKNNINPIVGEFDDPFNQRQGPVGLDFSRQGNTIIYGNAESGKETLLGSIVYDIMTTHDANEAQMYLLDFGSESLKIFKESPSVGDIIFSNATEKIERLFDMLQKEIKNRTNMLSDYGGDYNLYVTTGNKPMPMLIVAINNYEAFYESYGDEYDDLLLTLSRDGIKCGIVFVLVTSNYNDVRYRLSQNFKQKIPLLLNNDDEYLNILDGIGKKRPSSIFVRGLIKYEDVYEFQTARICESEKWNTYIKESIKELNKKAVVKAKKIPVLPSRVTFEDIKEELNGLEQIPLGLDKKTLNVIKINLKKHFINIITSKNIEISARYTSYIIEEIKHIKDVSIVLFDAEKIIQTEKNNIKLLYKNFKLEIENNLKNNKNVVCVIVGIDKFIDAIEEEFDEVLEMAEKLGNYNFVIIDGFSKIKNREYDEWYKNYLTGDSGIWVGNGISDQYLISIDNDENIVNNCGNSFGYLIEQEQAQMIKLLGMKEKGDENG